MTAEDRVRLFVIANSIAEAALDRAEQHLALDLGRFGPESAAVEELYYPQFDAALRTEASSMSNHYEVFYCLERSIRSLMVEMLSAHFGSDWWETRVSGEIKKNVEKNIKRERDEGLTPRSDRVIDYTTFGELGEIVKQNWVAFDDIFNSEQAFNRIMYRLNLLRGPIAHCCPLSEDEVLRLRLTVGDWFRLME